MIAYLVANNLPTTAAALREEVHFGEDVFDANTAKRYEGMLEKKWTSIARLQRKACPCIPDPRVSSTTLTDI
jgi:platelet-activating factor acetylhydrolase IB subunit alpha